MKRSEMINNLSCLISDIYINSLMDKLTEEELADKILMLLEGYGMAPPEVDAIEEGSFKKRRWENEEK